ncbi:glutathione S-transferase family protein [Billgrantia diversa]|uniref:glutathione S-transferase family protein n=1 Tax=Halomonas sp. MCCC 1A13316 TaxID=2733487 RepID=UPI0018A61222|nr:glutathione S-transferase family protein [Halomonas sp. MCCC 1A13316]QOR37364.1 glutathione S-transferase family protein [Halomonas sp. MCCC 1A13316]
MSASVHILGPQFSNFVRSVQLCCEEKGIPYTLGFELEGQPLDFGGARHLALHPFAKVPVLLHGERRLFETAPICRYLDANFDGPTLQPQAAWQRAEVDQWSQALSSYVDQAVVRRFLLEFVFPQGDGGSIRMQKVEQAKPEVVGMLRLIEHQLGGHDYLVGEGFSMADAILTPILDYLEGMPAGKPLVAEFPTLTSYLQRLRQRESSQRVLVPPRFA